ncbi:MAG: outer membrane lipoprotein chaperone LolA [Methyloprofundus sp.]|nr:outer membrane lipoprotein chaperone LolA [Methyloprofundus sp.]
MKKIIALVLVLFSVQAVAESGVKVLEKFIAGASHVTADFTQLSLDESGKPLQTSYGKFYLQQPGKFRWNYTKPYLQEIVSKEESVWFYDADLEQVIIKKIDQSIGDTPALLLSGTVDLKEKYNLTEQGTKGGIEWVKLIPKHQDSSFKHILIGLKEGLLSEMELSDNFGQLTKIMFNNLKLPKKLDKKIFEFKAPEGTDIFKG